MRGASSRVAAAPVSWGVFEVTIGQPGLPGPELVLDQMAAAGYAGTELGPPGFLGEADVVRERLRARGLSLVGAFLPQRFSRAEHAAEDRAWLSGVLDLLDAARPDEVRPKAVLSDASVEPDRLSLAGRIASHPEAALSASRWGVLVDNLHRAAEMAQRRGFDAVLHSHAGSYIETGDEIRHVADRLDPAIVGLCLDTGHARFGGLDPLEVLRDYGHLVRHVHIKDCDLRVMAEVIAEGGGLPEAWRRGVFCELGTGDTGIEAFVAGLTAAGYAGWLVVEQDRILGGGDTPEALLALQRRNREYLAARGF